MSKLNFFLVCAAVISLSISGCIFNADKYQSGDGIKGSAKYYLEDANKEILSGYFNFIIVSTFTDAYGRIMKEMPTITQSINKLISTSDEEASSAWEYLYWNASNENGKAVTALYDGISGIEDLSTPEATPVAINNWETDSPRAYKAVTDALEAAMIDISSLNSTGRKITGTPSLNLDNVLGMSILVPNKEWIYEIRLGPASVSSILSNISKKVAGSRINSNPDWWERTPMDHPIWVIVLMSDDLPDPFYGIVDGKTEELLESDWESDN